MRAGFKAGVKDGHHLQNRSQRDAVYPERPIELRA